jgi:hypothetical protein
VELEAAKFKDKKDAEGGPVEEPRCFITKKLATTFYEESSATARFLESAESNCYTNIYEERKGYCLVIFR